MYDGNLSLNSPDYRRKNLESSYRKNATKLSRYRNITREHARHYRGNSLESMELVRFLRGPFTSPCMHRFVAAKIDRPAFLRPFHFATLRMRRRGGSGEEARGMERGGERTIGTPRFAQRPTVINWREKRRGGGGGGRVASRGETDVAGVNRLNIFQPENGMGLELATLGKSRTPTFSLRLVWNNNDESSCLFPDTFE